MTRLPASLILAAALVLSACAETEREAGLRRVEAACGAVKWDQARFSEARRRALSGELAMIDCFIVRADTFLAPNSDPRGPVDSVGWRYIRWIVSDERPERIFDFAQRSDRSSLATELSVLYQEHLIATGALTVGRYDAAGCFRRPPKMDRLVQAARPSNDFAACRNSVRDHPSH